MARGRMIFFRRRRMKRAEGRQIKFMLQGLFALDFIDFQLKKAGWNRQRCQAWWRDFIKSPSSRKTQVFTLIRALKDQMNRLENKKEK